MKIGIAISTYKRPDVFKVVYAQIKKYLPKGAVLIVVSDFDPDAPPEANYTFNFHAGIPRVKNKCLEILNRFGCTDIFLFDDDCYPLVADWWKPYVESPEVHLMYQFKMPGKRDTDMTELYRDDQIVAYSHTRGSMLYIKRVVLEVVGGLDTAYGAGGYEHPDWSNRIHNAGLTSYRAMDIPNSGELLYCLDQDAAVESSILPQIKRAYADQNYRLYTKSRQSKEYKEFKSE